MGIGLRSYVVLQSPANLRRLLSLTPVPTNTATRATLLRARAIETQCYVVAAAQVGKHNGRRESWGEAMIIDPWGVVVARAPTFDELNDLDDVADAAPRVDFAEVDLAGLIAARTKMPVQQHRRYDLFAIGARQRPENM